MYPCSENKGADQLRGYREADLRLCFRMSNKPVFSRHGSYMEDEYLKGKMRQPYTKQPLYTVHECNDHTIVSI